MLADTPSARCRWLYFVSGVIGVLAALDTQGIHTYEQRVIVMSRVYAILCIFCVTAHFNLILASSGIFTFDLAICEPLACLRSTRALRAVGPRGTGWDGRGSGVGVGWPPHPNRRRVAGESVYVVWGGGDGVRGWPRWPCLASRGPFSCPKARRSRHGPWRCPHSPLTQVHRAALKPTPRFCGAPRAHARVRLPPCTRDPSLDLECWPPSVYAIISVGPIIIDVYILFLAWSFHKKMCEQKRGLFRGKPIMHNQVGVGPPARARACGVWQAVQGRRGAQGPPAEPGMQRKGALRAWAWPGMALPGAAQYENWLAASGSTSPPACTTATQPRCMMRLRTRAAGVASPRRFIG